MESEGVPGVVANKEIFDKEGTYDPKSVKDMSKTTESLNLR